MDTSLVIDSFLNDFDWLRAYCDQLNYSDVVNPTDGISYPGINTQIPLFLESEVIYKVGLATKKAIISSTMFFRMTMDGVEVPHQAHTDVTMGDLGLIVYLNRLEHCKGGTSFVTHKDSGLNRNPTNNDEQDIWDGDANNYDAWKVDEMCKMKPNRALIFTTDAMHRAEPPSGFGNSNEDSRLILCSFFKVA